MLGFAYAKSGCSGASDEADCLPGFQNHLIPPGQFLQRFPGSFYHPSVPEGIAKITQVAGQDILYDFRFIFIPVHDHFPPPCPYANNPIRIFLWMLEGLNRQKNLLMEPIFEMNPHSEQWYCQSAQNSRCRDSMDKNAYLSAMQDRPSSRANHA